jgi:SGNH domain (fused to AT3 domains)
VYLWHWPLYQVLTADRTGLSGPALLGIRVAATLAFSTVSYVLIEQPIRRGRLIPRRILPAATATALAAVVLAVFALTVPPRVASVPAASAPSTVVLPRSSSPSPAPRPAGTPRVTFFGDSVSWTLGTYWPRTPGLSVSVGALQGCGIATLPDIMELGSTHTNYPGCTQWPARWRARVSKYNPDVAVILLDRWELMDRKLDGHWTHVGEPDYDAYLAQQLRLAIDTAGSRGARVVLLTAPYTHRVERPDGGLYPEDQPSRVDAWNALLRQVAAAYRNPPMVIDLNQRVCPDGTFTWSIDGMRIRSDGLHFTPSGVQRWIAPWLAPQLAAQ